MTPRHNDGGGKDFNRRVSDAIRDYEKETGRKEKMHRTMISDAANMISERLEVAIHKEGEETRACINHMMDQMKSEMGESTKEAFRDVAKDALKDILATIGLKSVFIVITIIAGILAAVGAKMKGWL